MVPAKENEHQIRLILHSPDITLKGKNQKEFQYTLLKNVKDRLNNLGHHWMMGASRGRITIEIPVEDVPVVESAITCLQQIPGISSIIEAIWLHPRYVIDNEKKIIWSVIENTIVNLANDHYVENTSFAIQVNRTDKSFPVTSQELSVKLGNTIRAQTRWDRVQLKHPGQVFYIDVYPDGLFIYTKKHPGIGGLPVGTGGRVLALLSGGIDSPVAAGLVAKRGCSVDLFHLSANHIQLDELKSSVIARLAGQISRLARHCRLYVAPYTYFDLAMSGKNNGYELVLFRRFMMRTAEKLALKTKALALINGDSLGQVASQTLENLVNANRAIDIPVLRPLIGTNKDEIIKLAKNMGTYEISIQPYKDCCALIAGNPKTKARLDRLENMEKELIPNYDALIERTLQDMTTLQFHYGELINNK